LLSTVMKLYTVSAELVRSVLMGLKDSLIDFPFRVSPLEQEIIQLQPDPPASLLVVGRRCSRRAASVMLMYVLSLRLHRIDQKGITWKDTH
jgi:hypothetical protein